jgi:uncharacterized membrane protein
VKEFFIRDIIHSSDEEKYWVSVFENRELRRIFVPKRDGMTGG